MAEKRKPHFVIMLKFPGNTGYKKVELFSSKLWNEGRMQGWKTRRYRLRVKGKWFNDKKGEIVFYTKTQFRDLLMRSIKL